MTHKGSSQAAPADQLRTCDKGMGHAGAVEQGDEDGCQRNGGPLDESLIPRYNLQKHLITNGAGAGREVSVQRFINNLITIKNYLEALPGDQKFLSLVMLEGGKTFWVESEDRFAYPKKSGRCLARDKPG